MPVPNRLRAALSRPRTACAALLCLAVASGPPSDAAGAGAPAAGTARAQGALVGVADEHAGMFYSLAFRKLRVHITRLIVPWDTFLHHTRDVAWVTQYIRVS